MINILIADDHSIVRLGLKQILFPLYTSVTVVEADTFDDVILLLGQQTFELLILDINLPGGNNVQMMDSIRLRQPMVKILIFSAFNEMLFALNYLQAGADGYLEKTSDENEIKIAVNTILKNEKYFSPPVRQQLLNKLNQVTKHQNPFTGLSARETDVLNLLVKGIPVAKIAEMMHLHISTISTYKSRIFTKVGINNIVDLLRIMELHNFLI